jgi:hypothetical protein
MEQLQHAPDAESTNTRGTLQALEQECREQVRRYGVFMSLFNPYAFTFASPNGERGLLARDHPQAAQLCDAFWSPLSPDEKMRIAGQAAAILAEPLIAWIRRVSAYMDTGERQRLCEVVHRATVCAPQDLRGIVETSLRGEPEKLRNGKETSQNVYRILHAPAVSAPPQSSQEVLTLPT